MNFLVNEFVLEFNNVVVIVLFVSFISLIARYIIRDGLNFNDPVFKSGWAIMWISIGELTIRLPVEFWRFAGRHGWVQNDGFFRHNPLILIGILLMEWGLVCALRANFPKNLDPWAWMFPLLAGVFLATLITAI